MKTLQQALALKDKEFDALYMRVAEATWSAAATMAAQSGTTDVFNNEYAKNNFLFYMWEQYNRYNWGKHDTAADMTKESLAYAQQRFQENPTRSRLPIAPSLSEQEKEILNQACITQDDIMRAQREAMKEGSPREYAAAVTYDMTPAVAQEVTDYFMTNLQQMNPNMPANQAYAQAMYSALREFEIANDTGRNAEMLNNGTSLAISLAKMDVQLDMQEMGIDDRDDIGDDEVGDDD